MELSYDEIRRIHRLEKSSPKLTEVEEDFMDSLGEFLQGEKKTYMDSLKDMSFSKAKSYGNIKKMLEEIFSMRQRKILNLALISSSTGEAEYSNMTFQEKELCRELVKVLSRHNDSAKKVFDESAQAKTPAGQEKDLNKVSMRILREVPSFVGTDMKEYGPFKENQTVELPPKIAKLFVSRNLGKMQE